MNDEERLKFWSAFESQRFAECLERIRPFRDYGSGTYHEFLYGEVLRRLGRFQESERVIRASYSESHYFKGHEENSLGQILQVTGRLDEAIEWLRKATRSMPENPDPWNNLSSTLNCLGDLQGSANVLKEALARAEGCRDELYLNLGRVYRALDNYATALDCFDRALKLTPNYRLALDDREDLVAAMKIRT